MSFFDTDTAVKRVTGNRWQCEIKPGWRIGEVSNGGYVLAIAGRVLQQALPHKDPLSVNAFYLAPTQLGDVFCEVELLRQGGRTTFAQLKLFQQDEVKLVVTAAYTDIDTLEGESWSATEAPEYPSWEDCIAPEQPPHIEFAQRVEIRMVEGMEIFNGESPPGTGVFGGWVQHKDGSPADALSLLMFADAMPPPIFTVYGFLSWVPTVELTVQVRAKPAPGPLKVRFKTTQLSQGVLEEDGEIWDCNDQLVALSRQTAKLRVKKMR